MPSLSPSSASFSLSNSQHCATVDSTISWSAATPSFSQIVYKAKVAYLRRTNKNYSSSTWNRQLGTSKKCVTWGILFIVSAGARETTFCHSQMLPSLCVPRRDTDEDVSSSTSLPAAPRPYNVSLSFWAKSSQSVSRRVTEWVSEVPPPHELVSISPVSGDDYLVCCCCCRMCAVVQVKKPRVWRNEQKIVRWWWRMDRSRHEDYFYYYWNVRAYLSRCCSLALSPTTYIFIRICGHFTSPHIGTMPVG